MNRSSPDRKLLVVSGGTGFLGSHFLFHLRGREGFAVVPLVRAAGPEEARARIDRALGVCAASYSVPARSDSLAQAPLTGDIMHPWCGVPEATMDGLREAFAGEVELWHLAASLNFE